MREKTGATPDGGDHRRGPENISHSRWSGRNPRYGVTVGQPVPVQTMRPWMAGATGLVAWM